MRFHVQFNHTEQLLDVAFNQTEQRLDVGFKNFQSATTGGDAEYYKGSYEVTPLAEAQTLPTSGKILTEDVTIKPIPQEYGLVTYDNRKVITIT